MLTDDFERALWLNCNETYELGYYPKFFLRNMARIGAVSYARQLVMSKELQSGFMRLMSMGRLDLSIENLVIQPKFASLFTQDEIDAANWRLSRAITTNVQSYEANQIAGSDDMETTRLHDLRRFYDLLERLERALGGACTLAECSGGGRDWPARGVYFFQEMGEERSASGTGRRIVRVGTHALKTGSQSRLWGRLSQHKGQVRSGGGNHRGSIFRLIVGTALMKKDNLYCETWGRGSSTSRAVRAGEHQLERRVSAIIGKMPFLWLAVEDEPGPDSLRGFIERNSIALLSGYASPALDSPSPGWLGHWCNRQKVRGSGLWNSNHVDEHYDPAFIETLDKSVKRMESL